MATKKNRNVIDGPDPEDRVTHEMMRAHYNEMPPDIQARFDLADKAWKKFDAEQAKKKTTGKK